MHDNPYDQADEDARAEDRRQDRQEEAEEAENERRQLGCSYAYWWHSNNDEAYEPGDPKRSDFFDREEQHENKDC